MNIMIIGCGKTGCRLATELDELGHDVAVVDISAEQLEKLPEDFTGISVHGSGIDVDVLKKAGCENAEVAAVVTSNDNVNIMAAKILNRIFGISDVYVRLFDSSRESVFRKFGLRTVCATRIEKDVFLSLILGRNDEIEPVNISGTNVGFKMEKADRKQVDKYAHDILCMEDEMLFAVKKKDGTIHLANEAELTVEEGDRLIYAVI